MAFQPRLHCLHGLFGKGDTFFIDLASQLHNRVNTLPSHAPCPLQHGLSIGQFCAVPVLFQNPPATLHRIVFAVVWRVVQERDGLADVIGEVHHSVEKLRASTMTFRPIVGLDLQQRERIAFRGRWVVPPRVEAIHDEVAGLRGAAEGQVPIRSVLVHHAEGGLFFLAPPVVVVGLVIAARLTTTAVLADVHRGLAVHAQAHDRPPFVGWVLLVDVGEDGVGFRNFFWGLALSTGRSR